MNLPSPTQKVIHPTFDAFNIQVDTKRDDLIDPIISGNKWRKLKYLIMDAQKAGATTLMSMGGNYSNHLHALAFAAKKAGLNSIGFVRAHPEQAITPTLQDCLDWGMELKFISRKEYSELRLLSRSNSFEEMYSKSYWIKEGGFSALAVKGVMEIAEEMNQDYDYVFSAVGSGATLAGLAKGFKNSKVIGVAAFKGAEYLIDELSEYLNEFDNWQLDTEHHCGGFAKTNSQLIAIKTEFEKLNGYRLDKVYNAKVIYALLDFINAGKIPPDSKVLLLNTGGLQGERA